MRAAALRAASIGVSLLACTASSPLAQSDPLPVSRARRAVDAIRVDGVLDEMTWALAPRVGAFRLIHEPARQPAFSTEATVAWDDTRLYVAFASADPQPWGTFTERDDRLWEQEVVEVFLDPDGDGRQYAELEVSPHNVVVDLLIAAAGAAGPGARRWDAAGLQTAVARHPSGWVPEMAIPFASLAEAGVRTAPAPGTRWRVGLYRIERPGGIAKGEQLARLAAERQRASEPRRSAIDAVIEALRADDEYSAWSVTRPERGFHDPERFGYLEFTP